MKRSLLTIALAVITISSMAQNVTFGIITDIHTDIIHDGLHRLNTFLEVANKNKVDFVIDLGDFAMVKEDNKPFVDIWKNYTG